MKKPTQGEQQEKETLVDWLKGIGLVGIPLWIILFFLCCVGISECRDRNSKSRPEPPPYRTEDIYQHRPIENTETATKYSLTPIKLKIPTILYLWSGFPREVASVRGLAGPVARSSAPRLCRCI